jgi:2-methylisocitrate lyase-like PEP mutase family enzyme
VLARAPAGRPAAARMRSLSTPVVAAAAPAGGGDGGNGSPTTFRPLPTAGPSRAAALRRLLAQEGVCDVVSRPSVLRLCFRPLMARGPGGVSGGHPPKPVHPSFDCHVKFQNLRTRTSVSGHGLCAAPVSPLPLQLYLTTTTTQSPSPHNKKKAPCCYDGLSARLIERAGFPLAFMSGFSVAAARAGAPDAGLLSYGEIVDSLRACVSATSALPILADGDTGFGNALNVKRTVAGFAAAGAAGVLIEDQAWPKSCGHVRGKAVVGRGEAVARVRAAAAPRDELAVGDARVVLVARTDARQALGLDEALWRAAAFAGAGADVVFIDALESEDELRALADAAASFPRPVALMANNLEGGGKSPLLPAPTLARLGFRLVAYPLTLLGAAVSAQERALAELKAGALEPAGLPSFAHLQAAVGFPEYFAEADAYKAVADGVEVAGDATVAGVGGAGAATTARPPSPPPPPRPASTTPQPVEPDAVIVGGSRVDTRQEAASPSSSSSLRPTRTAYGSSAGPGSASITTTSFLRIRIVNTLDGSVRLETRIPAGFVDGLAAIVPQAAGLDLDGLARAVAGNPDWTRDQPIFKQPTGGGQEVEIYLE